MITIGCGVSDVFEQLDVSALRQPGLKSFGWERWLCLNSWDANIIQNTFQWVDLTIQTRMSWSVVYWCNCIWRQIVLRISHFLQIPGFTTTTITTTSTTTSFFNVSSPISPQIFLAQEHTSSGRKKTQDRLSVSSVDFASEIGCWIRLYIYIYMHKMPPSLTETCWWESRDWEFTSDTCNIQIQILGKSAIGHCTCWVAKLICVTM